MPKKKIKEIFIGSNNKGKLEEIADLLPNNLKIYSNLDYKIPSPLETGTTFKQNSLLKAKYFSKKTDKICMSDDSGIEIDMLLFRRGWPTLGIHQKITCGWSLVCGGCAKTLVSFVNNFFIFF